MNTTKEFEYLKSLLVEKKNTASEDEIDKIIKLEKLLEKDDLFLKIDLATGIGILGYLGVKKDEIKSLYAKLTSYDVYKNNAIREVVVMPNK